jgi:hypothetical protein
MTTTDKTTSPKAARITVPPMDREWVLFLQRMCTTFGLHRACPYKVCRRANACATRHVVCFQSIEEEMKPIVRSILARRWRNTLASGGTMDVAPVYINSWTRLLAQEEAEIPRIAAGEFGDDDALTPYQLWLKYWASRDEAAQRGRPRHIVGGEPYDPDARERDAPWVPPKIVKVKDAPPPSVAETPRRD